MDKVWKSNVEISPSCPRCGSSNTKFCYYNNYSLTQPRYFCKGCRRYWTKGGSLRNVPIGGGCRKTRRGNKPLRPSTNSGVVHSTSFDDLIINKHPYHHGLAEYALQDHDSSNSSPIDIARVYANFVNPTPDYKASGLEIPELHSEYDQSIGLTTNIGLPEDEQCLVGCPNEAELCDNDHLMYYSELGSIPTHKQEDTPLSFSTNDNPAIDSGNNNGLPPLPGEDHLQEDSHVMLWSDSSQSLIDDVHTFQVPQHLETFDPDHLFFGDWSPFQFSR